MSTTDSIVSSQTKQSSWRKSDTTWTLGLFGTAIGAGVLFFPIRAGFGRNARRFCQSRKTPAALLT